VWALLALVRIHLLRNAADAGLSESEAGQLESWLDQAGEANEVTGYFARLSELHARREELALRSAAH
jgi:hypothetical protein